MRCFAHMGNPLRVLNKIFVSKAGVVVVVVMLAVVVRYVQL